ncbi:MAG: hypothetical protein VR70_16245 [Rhodospirillaceae bacterium BRH_c57]|nr:MAG: hypothetical protein VR70_16245 [Rhodospirillaceae bacterium BRH_c57]
MSEEILLQFLEIGVVNVGSDDSKLEKLRDTAKDLAASLKKAPAKTVRWTLVAVDPEVSADDPVISDTWATLKKNWATVANSYQSIPISLLRATLLDALVQAASTDEAIAVAFTNSARNMLPHMPLGSEGPVWLKAIEQIEDLVDARAEAEWMTPELIKLASMHYEAPADISIGGKTLVTNRDVLKSQILAAAGPNGDDPNPYVASQQFQSWSKEFGTRMTTAVADSIDAVAKANKIAPVDLSPPLQQLASTVEDYVSEALKAFSGATAGLQRRTNLLWWKEALYSSSTRTSYRAMDPFTAASVMALDLFVQVPIFSPASVSAFLNEAILLLPKASSSDALDLPVIVEGLLRDPLTASLREAAQKLEPSWEGRGPLLAILGHLSHETLGGLSFRKATGFDNQVRMRPDVWGAHIFRELQAARAIQPNAAKRSRSKG